MGSARSVDIGGVKFGGSAPVRVESMLKTPLSDLETCIEELSVLKKAGCELARVAFPNESHKEALGVLADKSAVPLMADIHFNHRFALAALDRGVAIRINPGNMTDSRGLGEVLSAARSNGAVIRIGANGGSVNSAQRGKYGPGASALAGAVEEQLKPLLDAGFENVIISAKSSSVPETVMANQILAGKFPFVLHVGITEAGSGIDGAVKSAAGISVILSQGIGDTIRVSLTGDSKTEVDVAYGILRSLGLRKKGVNMISCPCCGRTRVDVGALCERVKAMLPDDAPDGLTVAVMGCEVNGPREAAAADIGIAGAGEGFVIFKQGVAVASGKIAEMENILAPCLREAFETSG
ncbi:MAG: (E)-4-hydroxy-3-methylbut-2-enyl-diphosphate synthase [Synergistaceae bacterium]|jgi:(E)-4-hydroxy-3-methylbut-2-enyl-diphosphate synthase|nr:(E)-4-hydroxy-3-methylbut-2-enyl-diphosphate synthase [Synergistaceae bacterium]